jgi:regulator of protease activity HflC (stomatin/prohibitin superfamily)
MKQTVLMLMCLMLAYSCSKVPAGHVGVKVSLYGSSKGVNAEVLDVGKYWIGVNEELYLFPLFKQTYPFTKAATEGSQTDESFDFQTVEGMSVNCDVGVTLHLEKDKVSSIFQTYQKGIDEIIHQFLRNEIRNAFTTSASKYKVDYVYGEGKGKLLKEVTDMVKAKMVPQGIVIEDLYLLGNFRLPQQVIDALNSKITATQRSEQKENELREAQAEAKKIVAKAQGDAEATLTEARAEAEANRIKMQSLTEMLIRYQTVQRWNGVLPATMAGNAVPFLNLGK